MSWPTRRYVESRVTDPPSPVMVPLHALRRCGTAGDGNWYTAGGPPTAGEEAWLHALPLRKYRVAAVSNVGVMTANLGPLVPVETEGFSAFFFAASDWFELWPPPGRVLSEVVQWYDTNIVAGANASYEIRSSLRYELVFVGLTPGMRYRVYWHHTWGTEGEEHWLRNIENYYAEFTADKNYRCLLSDYSAVSPYLPDGKTGNPDFVPPMPGVIPFGSAYDPFRGLCVGVSDPANPFGPATYWPIEAANFWGSPSAHWEGPPTSPSWLSGATLVAVP